MSSPAKISDLPTSTTMGSAPGSATYSFSLPSSPLLVRSQKSGRIAPPVTPQRLSRHYHQHSLSNSKSHSQHRSPSTPLTPYTPLSLRSFSSNSSSTLTTPSSIKHRSLLSPELIGNLTTDIQKDKSLADIAENWRSRASENGIKVSSSASAREDSHYADDEASDRTLSDAANDSGLITTEEGQFGGMSSISSPIKLITLIALQSPPFHRRVTTRPRAQSQATLPTARTPLSPQVTRRTHIQPASPLLLRTPSASHRALSSSNNSTLNSTPPTNRATAQLLKLKGSFTDPPHTRRRESFGMVSTTASTNHDFSGSLDLFDIDENDYEHEYENESPYEYENQYDYEPFSQYPQTFSASPFVAPFTSSLTSPAPFGQPILDDPFRSDSVLDGISEGVEHHFHTQHHQPQVYHFQIPSQPQVRQTYAQSVYQNPTHNPKSVPLKAASNVMPKESKTEDPRSCSVCARSNPSTLAILFPCLHPLCSACLTSALNIVGEKDMECAVCKRGVEDFKLINATPSGGIGKERGEKKDRAPLTGVDTNMPKGTQKSRDGDAEEMKGKSFMDPLFSSPGSTTSAGVGLRSAFEFAGTFGEGVRASTPKRDRKRDRAGDCVVLRIDNVPWDITPPTIVAWLQQPIERVHVLLDRKGKTLSHAFVEVRGEEIARAVLRGERSGDVGGKDTKAKDGRENGRGSVLGKGKRARGVTVTRSGQEELMRALFPAWRGTFDGSQPSLSGLDNDRVISALESGLMTEGEVAALLHLIKSPDSHFLKVPSLPFHSLISILRKFPADIDSRVFWSSALRDRLYDVTFAAIHILLSRIDQNKANDPAVTTVGGESDQRMELVSQLVSTAMEFQAFTSDQINQLSELLDSCSHSYGEHDSSGSESRISSPPTADLLTPHYHPNSTSQAHQQDQPQGPSEPKVVDNEPEDRAGPFGELAKEFGVEAQLVQALAQRLSGMC